jgi:predicted metal-binding protein
VILKRVKPLIEFAKADKIHFSSCMAALCPFAKKYKQVIEEAYPNVEVVMGTDSKPGHPHEMMKNIFHRLLTENKHGITEEFSAVLEKARQMRNK